LTQFHPNEFQQKPLPILVQLLLASIALLALNPEVEIFTEAQANWRGYGLLQAASLGAGVKESTDSPFPCWHMDPQYPACSIVSKSPKTNTYYRETN